jgi:GNAT superfamily N-acetyltransferase
MNVVRYADRPDLRARRYEELTKPTFPEYMNENEPGDRYWGRLYTDFPDFQVALVDGDELLAEAHAISLPWDGTVAGLPSGWDEGFELGMTSDEPHTALMAIAISVAPARQGQQLSSRMIQTFTDNARAAGLSAVVAPVRPTWKERYPLVPIERYAEWRRDDGTHFDPWIRIHERVGGETLAPAPESMTIRLSVARWEELTGMRLPEDGEYVFPGGLSTLTVSDGIGTHIEPNVWVLHRVDEEGLAR